MTERKITTQTQNKINFLELIAELTIGQRNIDTPKELSHFLHQNIFSKLGSLSAELYYPAVGARKFLPRMLPEFSMQRNIKIPTMLPADHPLLAEILISGLPKESLSTTKQPSFLATTGNKSHLLIPLIENTTIFALLYIGNEEHQPFSFELTTALQTLSAVIGSRLKSLETIRQLQSSMHALEYSEKLKATLYNISEQTHNAENIEDIYCSIHATISHLIHAPNFIIALVEDHPDGKFINFVYFSDKHHRRAEFQEIKLDRKKHILTTYLLEKRQPLLLTPDNFDRVCQENDISYIGEKAHSWLGCPFYVEHLSGAVIVQSYSKIVYTEKDKRLMTYVAQHIGEALNRRRAVEELTKTKNRAEQAEKNKSSFLANMSHDIRTPMNGIIGMTELVLDMNIPPRQRTFLNMVQTSADRLLKLINDILDFSKIDAGKLELELAPFKLRKAITETLEILTLKAEEKNVCLVIECDENIPDIIHGDVNRLCQILQNLVDNGLKFTPEGSVTLQISPVTEGVFNPEQLMLNFKVTDTGIGIPTDKIDQIFLAFKQVKETRNSNHTGTGLGLVIAAELVEMMGGKIRVTSTLEVGSTFEFNAAFSYHHQDVKLQKITDITTQTAPHQPRPGEPPLRILLVEDEHINRTLAAAVLKREGCDVTTAHNGHLALDTLKKGETNFDLILMDIQMPELNGYDTTRIIRENERDTGGHIPIIAMTAYAVKGDMKKCFDAGMDGYISKPIKPNLLHSEIASILQKPVESYSTPN